MHDSTRPAALPVLDPIVAALRSVASESSYEVYFVGGYVRDLLLGHPGKDIDCVVVHGDPVAFLTSVAAHLGWSAPVVFERFGTAQIRSDDCIVEAVRARAESYDPSSRKPNVREGSLEDDIWRRDFTANTLCQAMDGSILDLTGKGLADCADAILRTPLDPEATFAEDPLRMIRAARFVAQLDFSLAPGVLDAIRKVSDRIQIVSIERIMVELQRLLLADMPSRGLRILDDGNLLPYLIPELVTAHGVEQGGFHTYDVFEHTLHTIDATPANLVTRLAALFHDIGKPETHALGPGGKHTFYGHAQAGATIATHTLERLRMSQETVRAVAHLVELHLRPIQYSGKDFSDAAVRRLIRDAGTVREEMIDLAIADTLASSYPSIDGLVELKARMDRLEAEGQYSRLSASLTGEEIMERAGRPPGPWIRAVKKALEEAILDGTIPPHSPEAERLWLDEHSDLLQDHPV